jgi:iron complex outermembrane recepter protein
MKYVLFFSIMVITPCILLGQNTVSGKVSSISGSPIPNASVHLLSGPKKNKAGTVLADSTGAFIVPVIDSFFTFKCFIYATYLNYRSDTIAVNDLNNFYDIKIKLSENVLPDVVIESRASVVKRLADRFIFTPDKLLSEGATALDVLKFAPLVQFDEKTNLFSIINKTGTVVYINNRKSNWPKEMIISALRSTAANDIKSIEIITNPGSEYPANTSGGVININLKKMFDEGWSGNLMVASEQAIFNTSMLNGAVNYRKGKVGIRVSPFLNSSFNYNTKENWINKDAKYQRYIKSIQKCIGDIK